MERLRVRKRGDVRDGRCARAALAAIGLEAEFATVVDGKPARPEEVFGSPRRSCADR